MTAPLNHLPTAGDAADMAGPDFESIESGLDVTYTWGYQDTRKDLRDLYLKARRRQWNPDEVLDFSIDVDLEKAVAPEPLQPLFGSDIYNRLSDRDKVQMNIETSAYTLSNFLHGEQGALLASAQLVQAVPDYDSKMYAATQVVDEARHVDVYNRYLHEKVGFAYPMNRHLRTLLDLILKDSRWDMKLLGMQIMVEGLALAAFAMIRNNTYEPLLRDITRYVIADEARHVAYGVLSLRDYYADLNETDRAEREDFVYEASVLMRDRFLMEEVWEKLNLPVAECMDITLHNTGQQMFRQMLFAKIVPAVKKVGLLSDRQRARFAELGILQYENWEDPTETVDRDDVVEAAAPA